MNIIITGEPPMRRVIDRAYFDGVQPGCFCTLTLECGHTDGCYQTSKVADLTTCECWKCVIELVPDDTSAPKRQAKRINQRREHVVVSGQMELWT